MAPVKEVVRITAITALLAGTAATANAQSLTGVDVEALGPQVGERVPDFNLPDQSGEYHSLESVLGPNGALLLFHRSADW